MKEHLLKRLGMLLAIIILPLLLFFILFNEPAAAMGASIICVALGSLLGFIFMLYLLAESVVLLRKGEKRRGFTNLGIGLSMLFIMLFILEHTLFDLF